MAGKKTTQAADEQKPAEAKDVAEAHSGTPSSIAVAEVGGLPEDPSDEQVRERAVAYQAAKRKARWG